MFNNYDINRIYDDIKYFALSEDGEIKAAKYIRDLMQEAYRAGVKDGEADFRRCILEGICSTLAEL